MKSRFAFGFAIGLMLFLLINLFAAHLASDCGLPALIGLDSCADDITRAGWPFRFYEDGGFVYRQNFSLLSLLINLATGLAMASITGWFLSRGKTNLSK